MVRSHRILESEGKPVVPTPRASSDKVGTNSPKADGGDFNISELTDGQIHTLLYALQHELHERAMNSDDPEVLGIEFLGKLNGNDVEKPEVVGERFVAVGGIVKYNPAGTKHQCVLYSVTMPGAEPFWVWEDHGTLAYSQSSRVGEMRQSVALHVAIDGMQFIRHTMKHDGEKHTRISEDAWDCVWADDGAGKLQIVRSKSVPRNLPVSNH